MAENLIRTGEGTRIYGEHPCLGTGFRILEGSLCVFCSCPHPETVLQRFRTRRGGNFPQSCRKARPH